jgi:6-pyruvoyltetrahydropterin/6-carboxytetrahydropterin synthase
MEKFKYRSTKLFGHNTGLSVAFRQWRAHSHCSKVHGYPLSFKFEFGTNDLDERNWVVDFGGLKGLKTILEDTFDHKTIVAEDDPHLEWFREGERLGTLDLVVLPKSGCEMFAKYVFEVTEQWLIDAGFSPRCTLLSVEVREHESNSASYMRTDLVDNEF